MNLQKLLLERSEIKKELSTLSRLQKQERLPLKLKLYAITRRINKIKTPQ